MTDYKDIYEENSVKPDSNDIIITKNYIPQLIDLPNLYRDIQEAFSIKNPEILKSSMEKLKKYLSAFLIQSPIQFQEILFPILTTMCRITDNDDLVFYGFEYISLIMKKYTSYIPLFTEPSFFDFFYSFLTVPNQKKEVIFWALKSINNFILLSIDARNYTIERFRVNDIINNYILNENFLCLEDDQYNVGVKALEILNSYVLYPIDESNAKLIYNLCDPILDAEPKYSHYFEGALWIIFNLIQNNPEFQKIVLTIPNFPDKIETFTYDSESEKLIPSLKILIFLISNNLTFSNNFFKYFLYILCDKNDEVSKIAFHCFELILDKQTENAIKEFYSNDFIINIENILKKFHFNIKMKAANVACTIIEKGISKNILLAFQFSKHIKGLKNNITFIDECIRVCLTILQFEDDYDNIIIRAFEALGKIFLECNTTYFIDQNEEIVLQEKLESSNYEIAKLANDFYIKFGRKIQRKDVQYTEPQQGTVRKQRRRVKKIIEEQPQPTKINRIRMWNPKKSTRNYESNNTENDNDLSYDELTPFDHSYSQNYGDYNGDYVGYQDDGNDYDDI